MVNKKYLLLAGLLSTALIQPAFAQESGNGTGGSGASYQRRDMTYRGDSYDAMDTTVIPGRRMDQHRKYLNHQYNFPAKPRNMVELGISAGLYNYSGDVSSQFIWNSGKGGLGGYGLGAHIRKAFGYVFSGRLDYNYGIAKGINFQPSGGFANNSAWANKGYTTNVFYNYRSESHQLNFDLVASFGNLLFHHSRTKVDPYIFAGVGANAYQTWVNALNGSNQAYNAEFNSILTDPRFTSNGSFQTKDRKEIKEALDKVLDDTYETAAQSDRDTRRPSIFKTKKLSFVTSFGAGVQFRLSRRVNLSLEDRVTFFPTTNEDLLDGQKYDEGNAGGPTISQNKDGINYASVGLNFNVGGGSRNVEPLYWLNPLDYSYGELSNPRHMILPEPILPDADGDGIADQFDKCPGTPAGVAVDSHGCPMDTDGDGVPDDRDKQLITPTECQPVDADGVGKCPCPDGCKTMPPPGCNIGSGTIMFSSSSSKITPSMQAQLAALSSAMSANPNCRVVIMGAGGGNKVELQRSWDRVNAVIEYMAEKNNVDRNRFIFKYDGGAPANSVMYRSAQEGEAGGSTEAPPAPNLRH